MALEQSNLEVAKFTDEVVRNMSSTFFSISGKFKENSGGGRFLEEYQNFMENAREEVYKFALYLSNNGISLDDYNLNLVSSSVVNMFFSTIVSNEDAERYLDPSHFVSKYLNSLYDVYQLGEDFSKKLNKSGIQPYDTATRTSLDVTSNYYASMNETRKEKFSRDLEGHTFINDAFDYLEMVYPLVVDFDITKSQLAVSVNDTTQR